MEKNKLYIYLAKLDRKGMEVIAAIPHRTKVYPTRVKDISSLGLNPEVANFIHSKAAAKRMTHEVFCESASSYEGLKDSLKERGYKNLPTHQFTGYSKPSSVNDSALVTKDSTMLRRASR